MVSAQRDTKDAVRAMRFGAFDYLGKPFNPEEVVALAKSACQLGSALAENERLKSALSAAPAVTGYLGDSAETRELLARVAKAAALDLNVLITGESGTGKTLLARVLHQASARRESPFVTVSCPTLPRELIESELFGHEKGAFTGAHQRRTGQVEVAEGGTLFLDEIGELPLSLQPKLLNYLQDRRYHRVGGHDQLTSNVRIIAATNATLPEKVRAGEFRQDLYYRLNVVQFHLRPLRERRADIPTLVTDILARIASNRGTEPVRLEADALAQLQRHAWPGNVRQLENVLERATVFCADGRLRAADLVLEEHGGHAPLPVAGSPVGGGEAIGSREFTPFLGMPLRELERLAVLENLKDCGNNKAETARRLGLSEQSVHNKLKQYRDEAGG
jgi:DNA-binding NtrC family response regulator